MPTLEVAIDASGADRGANRFSRAMARIRREGSLFQRTARIFRTGFQRIGRAAATAARFAARIGTVIGGVAFALAGGKVAKTASNFESLRIQLETVTGSAEAAAKAFEVLQGLSTTTPNTLNQLTQAYIQLESVGIKPTIDTLRNFSDIAAANAKSVDQFAEAVRGAVTGEFERLKAFNIVARADGDQVRFIFRGVETQVDRSAEAMREFFDEFARRNFQGAGLRLMETVQGAFSNTAVAAENAADRIGTKGGLNDALTKLAGKLTELLENEKVVDFIGTTLVTAVEALTAALNAFIASAELASTLLEKLGKKDGKTLTPEDIDRIARERQRALQRELELQRLEAELGRPGIDRLGNPRGIGPAVRRGVPPSLQGSSPAEEAAERAAAKKATEESKRLAEALKIVERRQRAVNKAVETMRTTTPPVLARLRNNFNQLADDLSDAARNITNAWVTTMLEIEDTIIRAVETGKVQFKDLVDTIRRELIRLAVRQFILAPVNTLLAAASGGILGAVSGGGGGGILKTGATASASGTVSTAPVKTTTTRTSPSAPVGDTIVMNVEVKADDASTFDAKWKKKFIEEAETVAKTVAGTFRRNPSLRGSF